MRTVVVSDLHLGLGSGADLLRRARFREPLIAELEGVDRLILLGDVLELRDRPLAEALELARPFFDELGSAIGTGRVVLVPGNHDHAFAEPWLVRLRLEGER
ncbi:MAG: metallophosphoesterase, partial [Solirubrobacterales bacterium]